MHSPAHLTWPEVAPTAAGDELRKSVLRLGSEYYGYAPEDADDEDEDPLGPLNCLAILRWLERSIDVEYAFLIAQARTEGASWSEIGKCINLTKQAAQQRFGEIVDKITPFCTDDGGPSPEGELEDVLDRHYQGKRNFYPPGAIAD